MTFVHSGAPTTITGQRQDRLGHRNGLDSAQAAAKAKHKVMKTDDTAQHSSSTHRASRSFMCLGLSQRSLWHRDTGTVVKYRGTVRTVERVMITDTHFHGPYGSFEFYNGPCHGPCGLGTVTGTVVKYKGTVGTVERVMITDTLFHGPYGPYVFYNGPCDGP